MPDIVSQLDALVTLHDARTITSDDFVEMVKSKLLTTADHSSGECNRKRKLTNSADKQKESEWAGDVVGVSPDIKPATTKLLGKTLECMATPILNKQGKKDAVKHTMVVSTRERVKWDAEATAKHAIEALAALFDAEPARKQRAEAGGRDLFKIGISTLDSHNKMTRMQQMDYRWATEDGKRILVCGIGPKDPTIDYGFSDEVSRTIEDKLIDALQELVGSQAVRNRPTGARKGNKSQHRDIVGEESKSTVRYAYIASCLDT